MNVDNISIRTLNRGDWMDDAVVNNNNTTNNSNNVNHQMLQLSHHNHHSSVPPLIRYPPTNNSLLSSGNTKKAITYEPRTEAISPALNDDIINAEDSNNATSLTSTSTKSTKDEQTLLVEKLKKVEADILQTEQQITRLRRQRAQLEQAANSVSRDDDEQENVCDTKQLSIAKLVYHENRAKAQKAHAKLENFGGGLYRDLPIYNQPSDNAIYHLNAAKFTSHFKTNLIACFRERQQTRLKLEESVSREYDRRMEKWLKNIEQDDSQPNKRLKDARTREFFEKQFPELKKARESGERFSRVGQRVARSDAELDEIMDGITEREDQDKKAKSYAVIPPTLEEMRSKKPSYMNKNGYVEDIISEYKEYQYLNTWTDEQKEIFRENYLQHPKNFGLIATMTQRKNVANCVHYYYLSKKGENYKQQLKRQQKRRTRSFVRPAAHTAPIPETTNNDNAKSNGFAAGVDNQGGDSTKTDCTSATDHMVVDDIEGSTNNSSDRLSNQVNKTEATNGHGSKSISSSCCICDCQFSESNQFRNVTRSNYQLYGIGADTLKPGMRICYPCRFRHVKHPSSQEVASMSPDPYEEEEEIDPDAMDVNTIVTDVQRNFSKQQNLEQLQDQLPPQKRPKVPRRPRGETYPPDIARIMDGPPPPPYYSKPVGALMTESGSTQQTGVAMMQANSLESVPLDATRETIDAAAVGADLSQQPQSLQQQQQPPTCVRDIIYQAIEMSFQDPKAAEQLDMGLKPRPPLVALAHQMVAGVPPHVAPGQPPMVQLPTHIPRGLAAAPLLPSMGRPPLMHPRMSLQPHMAGLPGCRLPPPPQQVSQAIPSIHHQSAPIRLTQQQAPIVPPPPPTQHARLPTGPPPAAHGANRNRGFQQPAQQAQAEEGVLNLSKPMEVQITPPVQATPAVELVAPPQVVIPAEVLPAVVEPPHITQRVASSEPLMAQTAPRVSALLPPVKMEEDKPVKDEVNEPPAPLAPEVTKPRKSPPPQVAPVAPEPIKEEPMIQDARPTSPQSQPQPQPPSPKTQTQPPAVTEGPPKEISGPVTNGGAPASATQQLPPPPAAASSFERDDSSPSRGCSRSPDLAASPASPSEMVIDESAGVRSASASPSSSDVGSGGGGGGGGRGRE